MNSIFLNYYLIIREEILVPVIENAPLSNVMAYTRSGKNKMLLYNLVIMFFLTTA